MSDKPLLWHIPVSHYSEKARWALAHKRIEHERRAPIPGAHMAIALWLTRGQHEDLPGAAPGRAQHRRLDRDHRRARGALAGAGRSIRRTRRARRALELEEYFDEQLGPQIRLLVWHELRTDRERMEQLSEGMMPRPARDNPVGQAVGARFGSAWVQLRFRVADDEAAEAREPKVVAALDRLEAELDATGRRLPRR